MPLPHVSCCSGGAEDAEIVCVPILNELDLAPEDLVSCSGVYEVRIEVAVYCFDVNTLRIEPKVDDFYKGGGFLPRWVGGVYNFKPIVATRLRVWIGKTANHAADTHEKTIVRLLC